MGRGIGHMQIEGLLLIPAGFQEFHRVVGDGVGDVALLPIELSVFVQGRAVVRAAAGLMAEPVAKALLHLGRSTHMPLAGQCAVVAAVGQGPGIGILPGQILDCRLALVVIPQPVVHAVLGGDAAGKQRSPGRAANR